MTLLETDPVVEAAERQRMERLRAEEAARKALEEQRIQEEQEENKRREAESLKRKEEEEKKRKIEDEMFKAKLAREKELQKKVEEKMKQETATTAGVKAPTPAEGSSPIAVIGGAATPSSSTPSNSAAQHQSSEATGEPSPSEATKDVKHEQTGLTEQTETPGRVTRSSSRLQAKTK